MTDAAVPATTDRITELLAAHYGNHPLIRGANIARQECICGEWSITNRSEELARERHRAHVAALLAVLVADAQTDAWDQGAIFTDREWQQAEYSNDGTEGYEFWGTDLTANPYRKENSGEGEKLQQQIDASEGEEHAGSDKVVGTHTPHNTPERNENP